MKPTATFLPILLTAAAVFSDSTALGQAETTSEATFYVHWYSVGASALEGLDGVTDVTKGFRGSKEINTVTYDPEKVSVEQMTEALKEAGTYRGLAE